MKRVWSKAARQHLDAIHAYLARDNAEAAERVVAQIIRATERLEYFPNSARRGTVPGTHELVVVGRPYVVV